jgi:hypothetical protein
MRGFTVRGVFFTVIYIFLNERAQRAYFIDIGEGYRP